jgi:lysophospholipase L1-like esterase
MAGGEPLLLMVWPPLERAFAWDDVRDSYRAAGAATGARVVEAGERIRALLEADPSAPLLAEDGFHPAPAGSRAIADAIVDVLLPPRHSCAPAAPATSCSSSYYKAS